MNTLFGELMEWELLQEVIELIGEQLCKGDELIGHDDRGLEKCVSRVPSVELP
mgnify:CR=1 FL=1